MACRTLFLLILEMGLPCPVPQGPSHSPPTPARPRIRLLCPPVHSRLSGPSLWFQPHWVSPAHCRSSSRPPALTVHESLPIVPLL